MVKTMSNLLKLMKKNIMFGTSKKTISGKTAPSMRSPNFKHYLTEFPVSVRTGDATYGAFRQTRSHFFKIQEQA